MLMTFKHPSSSFASVEMHISRPVLSVNEQSVPMEGFVNIIVPAAAAAARIDLVFLTALILTVKITTLTDHLL